MDAHHEYEAVRQDFEDWSVYLKVGGSIAFHDTGGQWAGPTRLVNEQLHSPA
jgi:hypothetical protein